MQRSDKHPRFIFRVWFAHASLVVCAMQALVERLCGTRFNSCLLNKYRGGGDYMGWHRDDEKVYAKNSTIGSVSS